MRYSLGESRQGVPVRFTYELGGTSVFTTGITTSQGSTHTDSLEALAFLSLVMTSNSAGQTISAVKWDGSDGDSILVATDNSDGEHRGAALSLINITNPSISSPDYEKAIVVNGVGGGTIRQIYLRLIGGTGTSGITVRDSQIRQGVSYPISETMDVAAGDIVVVVSSIRDGTDTACSDMTEIYADGTYKVFAAIAPSAGTFSTTITSSFAQQYVHIIASLTTTQ